MITPDFYIYPHFSVRSTIPHTLFRPTTPTPMAVKRIDGNEKREKANNLSIFGNNPSFNWEKWANFADEIVKTS